MSSTGYSTEYLAIEKAGYPTKYAANEKHKTTAYNIIPSFEFCDLSLLYLTFCDPLRPHMTSEDQPHMTLAFLMGPLAALL